VKEHQRCEAKRLRFHQAWPSLLQLAPSYSPARFALLALLLNPKRSEQTTHLTEEKANDINGR
jgi:hypothetical protein